MKVHHLNCGTMRMPSITLCCHVLLIENGDGLVLVDTGFGLLDIADPRRVGPQRRVNRPTLDPAQTAVRQIRELGLNPGDVRHVITTHLDSDHVGGLADFPDATLHLTAAEAQGAMHSPSWRERLRYRPELWSHDPKIVEYAPEGESWRGLTAQELTDIGPGIVLVPMPGHTRGHTAVAVDAGHRWVLHCGDAFLHPGRIDGRGIPVRHALLENMLAFDRDRVHDNHARVAELYRAGDPDLLIVCAHDQGMFEQAVATAR
ncbi:MBL fold metallo-hydrolase [Nocardia concava]|uniref:MBL fold metallo-hydrolase n=1 Tax=Nocardia concava TaxID=257281 RepID=UPI0002DAFD0E|nr:MBL fold metallo-hydrolase [Nocardia concava]